MKSEDTHYSTSRCTTKCQEIQVWCDHKDKSCIDEWNRTEIPGTDPPKWVCFSRQATRQFNEERVIVQQMMLAQVKNRVQQASHRMGEIICKTCTNKTTCKEMSYLNYISMD